MGLIRVKVCSDPLERGGGGVGRRGGTGAVEKVAPGGAASRRLGERENLNDLATVESGQRRVRVSVRLEEPLGLGSTCKTAARSDCSSIFQGFNRQGEVAPELGRSQALSWQRASERARGTRDSSWTAELGWSSVVLSQKEGEGEKKKQTSSCLFVSRGDRTARHTE